MYQGHKNRNHWNVSLWIDNDYGLYSMALAVLSERRGKNWAARAMLISLREKGITHTPDGAPYTYSSVRAALTGMEP